MALSVSSRRFLLVLAVVGALVLGVVGAGFFWVNQQLAGTGGPHEPIEIEIVEGSSASGVGSTLEDAGVIRNAFVFRLRARSRGVDNNIVAGRYAMETGMSVDDALDVLEAGPLEDATIRLTIAEGLTVAQTLARLDEQTDFSVADYRAVLDDTRLGEDPPLRLPDWVPALDGFGPDIEVFEGLLFPETYEFAVDVSVVEILQRLLDEVEIAMATPTPSAVSAAADAGLDRYQALIAASLVEREARVSQDRLPIAAVIRNRLARGMPLQIDATLLYAAGTPDGGPGSVNTDINSPYNTYQVAGLPPTPISGARADAIKAVFEPADVDYLYYVVSPACDGSHNFAMTLDEHNANVRAYREAGRCQ